MVRVLPMTDKQRHHHKPNHSYSSSDLLPPLTIRVPLVIGCLHLLLPVCKPSRLLLLLLLVLVLVLVLVLLLLLAYLLVRSPRPAALLKYLLTSRVKLLCPLLRSLPL